MSFPSSQKHTEQARLDVSHARIFKAHALLFHSLLHLRKRFVQAVREGYTDFSGIIVPRDGKCNTFLRKSLRDHRAPLDGADAFAVEVFIQSRVVEIIDTGKSVGINIALPFEQEPNKYIDSDKLITFNYFFIRKVMFVKYAQGFIVLPGGYGTLDELFEALTLIQTKKIGEFPIVLVGSEYWGGIVDWIVDVMLNKKNISPEDMNLFTVVDSADEAVKIIIDFYSQYLLSPNF